MKGIFRSIGTLTQALDNDAGPLASPTFRMTVRSPPVRYPLRLKVVRAATCRVRFNCGSRRHNTRAFGYDGLRGTRERTSAHGNIRNDGSCRRSPSQQPLRPPILHSAISRIAYPSPHTPLKFLPCILATDPFTHRRLRSTGRLPQLLHCARAHVRQ